VVRVWDRLRSVRVTGLAFERTKHLSGMGPVSLVPSGIGKGAWTTTLGEGPHVLGHAVHVLGWVAESVTFPPCIKTVRSAPEPRIAGNCLVGVGPPPWFLCHFGVCTSRVSRSILQG
jgi:hypothetical protein